MEQNVLEGIKLNWNPNTTIALNFAIAFIMFGVALGLKRQNFIDLFKFPKATIVGVISQFILLPCFTFILVWIFDPLPGLALGMILVAACPGGNVSNFFTSLAGGNVALSISLTVIASFMAVIFTPLNFQFWGGLMENTSGLLRQVNIDFFQMVRLVAITIVIPLILGIGFGFKFPILASKIRTPVKYLSIAILLAIIVLAFWSNYELFLEYYHLIVILVLVHNALALAIGFYFSKAIGVSRQDVKTITIETGIQNSGLGLLIVFSVFNGQGGMALITAWWGIWHLVSGFAVSQFFLRKSKQAVTT